MTSRVAPATSAVADVVSALAAVAMVVIEIIKLFPPKAKDDKTDHDNDD